MDLPVNREMMLGESEYRLFKELVYDRSGINLGDNKRELVKARLMKRIRFHGLNSYREYYELILNDRSGDEMTELLNAISTNVTSFFREKQHFDFMTKVAMPRILEAKKRQRSNRLRIWCAATATGEEVYTILMTLVSYLGNISGWDIKLLGTDISTKALKHAQAGVYPADKLRQIPMGLSDRFFSRFYEGKQAYGRVRPELADLAFFRHFNLMSPTFPFKNRFDMIWCRNVMIYFDKPTQEILVRKMHKFLESHGFLFIGHSESLMGAEVGFKSVSPSVFVKN